MKKFVFATLAAASLFASVGAASAQSMQFYATSPAGLSLDTGGASLGYNAEITSLDSIK